MIWPFLLARACGFLFGEYYFLNLSLVLNGWICWIRTMWWLMLLISIALRWLGLSWGKKGLRKLFHSRSAFLFSCKYISISLIGGLTLSCPFCIRYYVLICRLFTTLLSNIKFWFDWVFEVYLFGFSGLLDALLHESSTFLRSCAQEIKLICHCITSPILQINVVKPWRLKILFISSELLFKLLHEASRFRW